MENALTYLLCYFHARQTSRRDDCRSGWDCRVQQRNL